MDGDTGEHFLEGGNVSAVVRVGGTVRRQAGPWSSGVDAVLLHLERAGFDGAPRALGYDQLGRQVLSYVEGTVDASPSDLSTSQLAAMGRLVRDFHDAMESFVPPVDAAWQVPIPPDRRDLVCHHDIAPWNLVRAPGRLVLIDWDGAGPGSRLWDLAYAVHGFVPLSGVSPLDEGQEVARLLALVDGYGLEGQDRTRLVELLAPRTGSMYELLRRGHETGEQPWSRLYSEGHGDYWYASARYAERRCAALARAIVS